LPKGQEKLSSVLHETLGQQVIKSVCNHFPNTHGLASGPPKVSKSTL